MDKYVLITGSGSGFGKALAFEMAEHGYHLLLVSLKDSQLVETKKELQDRFPGIKVQWLAIDLLHREAHLEIYRWVKENHFYLCGLINNVGIGYYGHYEEVESVFLENLLQLNVMLTHNMCRQFFEELKNNKPSFIHNVSSLAAFYALPYKTVYAATKAFVLNYSLGLRAEMKAYGIEVSCSCPGAMLTNFGIKRKIKKSGWRKNIISVSKPDLIAKITVRRMFNHKGVIIPDVKDRIVLKLSRLLPHSTLTNILARVAKINSQ